MLIKNIGKRKFVLDGGRGAPSKKFPQGEKMVLHVSPGQTCEYPDSKAEALVDLYPLDFAEYSAPTSKKATQKPATPVKPIPAGQGEVSPPPQRPTAKAHSSEEVA